MIRYGTAAALAAWLLALPAAPAVANDSTAAIDAGGIVLIPAPTIRLESEDLFISKDAVRVHYRFRNTGNAILGARVAFPLPPFEMSEGAGFSVPTALANPDNFMDFRVRVNGVEVTPQIEGKALVDGRDVTSVLRRHQIPLTYFGMTGDEVAALFDRIAALPQAAKDELVKAGLIDPMAPGEDFVNYHWTVKYTYHWEQDFPGGEAVEVVHDYAPVPGAFFIGAWSLDDFGFTSGYCVDESFKRAVRRRLQNAANNVLLGYDVRYILTTANNWAGPIGHFRLTIDKGAPDNLVSLCINGITKTGPTTFVFEAENFEPTRELNILFAETVDD